MSNPINRHSELQGLLERLKLAGMAQSFADLALKAAKEGLSHEAYLHELARREEALRHERRTDRLLRQIGLPLEKTFRTLDLGRLSQGNAQTQKRDGSKRDGASIMQGAVPTELFSRLVFLVVALLELRIEDFDLGIRLGGCQ